MALAAKAEDTNPFSTDEPYRRAVKGIYARLYETARGLLAHDAPGGGGAAAGIHAGHADHNAHGGGHAGHGGHHGGGASSSSHAHHGFSAHEPHRHMEAYGSPREVLADLATVHASLALHGAGPLAQDRLEPLQRKIEVFGFHMAVMDLRQNSKVHEEVVGELLARAGLCAAAPDAGCYASLSEDDKVALLARELGGARPLYSPHLGYSARTQSELAIVRAAADVHRRFGEAAVPNYIISNCTSLSDMLEVGVLLKEAGLVTSGGGVGAAASTRLHMNIIPRELSWARSGATRTALRLL